MLNCFKREILCMSLPSRERGLKLKRYAKSTNRSKRSLPSRERGLKYKLEQETIYLFPVAPFAGAWIEMLVSVNCIDPTDVAPFAGAWIEIYQ